MTVCRLKAVGKLVGFSKVLSAAAAVLMGSAFADEVTVGGFTRLRTGFCSVQVTAEPAAINRAVFVAWGDADKGETLSAWGGNVRSADGFLPAGSRQARVTLPTDALTAKVLRAFLVADGCLADFIQTDGRQYIVTDVYPDGRDTRVFIDFAMQDVTTVQQRLFGNKGDMNMQAYVNGSKGWSWSYSNAGNWTAATDPQTLATKDRTQVTLDGPGDAYTLVIKDVQKASVKLTAKTSAACGNKSNNPLNIFANAKDSDKYGNLKLYAVQMSTTKGVNRNYLPCVRAGVACLYETVTGAYLTDAVGTAPLFAGAPTNATPSAVSAAFAVPAATAAALGAGGEVRTLGVGYQATGAAREIWLCWDEADRGETFSAWANNERVGVAAANSAFAQCPVPPSAVGAKASRCFLVAPGGDYDCTYIRAERLQAIDTGILASKDMSVTADFKLNDTVFVQQRAFGVDDNAFTFAAYINGGGNWAWGAQDDKGNWKSADVKPVGERTKITLDSLNNSYKIEVGGKTVKTMALGTTRTKQGAITVALLAAKSKTATYGNCAVAELYSAQVSTNGVLVRDFSPCATNGVAVLRDAVSGDYFGNVVTSINQVAFIPGGRKDSPAAVAAAPVDLSDSRCDDVFADAKFWFRGVAEDVNGNGIVDDGEFCNRLDGKFQKSTVYGASGRKMAFSNELVRLAGRGVGRQMQTVYLPQTLTITNAAAGKGYIEPTTALLSGCLSGVDNHWTTIIRCRPDAGTPPNALQFLMSVGHSGGATARRGVEFGFRDTGDKRRLLCLAGGSEVTTSWQPISGYATISNLVVDGTAWVDVAIRADGQKLTAMLVNDWERTGDGSGTTLKGVTQIGYIYLASPISLKPSSVDLRLFGEASANDKRLYPMGANDNAIKCFRGSIQQVAFWDRSLSQEELFMAVGWPRTDLFRVGVANDSDAEFSGEMPADGLAADDEHWPLQAGLAAGESLTVRFPLRDGYETDQAQILRWKGLSGSVDGQLRATVNGRVLDSQAVRAGEWAQWYVPARYLRAGTNDVVFARTDSGAGAVKADVVALGGGFQIGLYDGTISGFSLESVGLKDYYVASGNFRDVRRVVFCAASTSRTNFWTHLNLPAEMAGRYRWRFRMSIADQYGFDKAKTQLLSIDLNGKELFSQDVTNKDKISFLIQPEDLKAGENVFNIRNSAGNYSGNYIPLDAFSLEPRSPSGLMYLLR